MASFLALLYKIPLDLYGEEEETQNILKEVYTKKATEAASMDMTCFLNLVQVRFSVSMECGIRSDVGVLFTVPVMMIQI